MIIGAILLGLLGYIITVNLPWWASLIISIIITSSLFGKAAETKHVGAIFPFFGGIAYFVGVIIGIVVIMAFGDVNFLEGVKNLFTPGGGYPFVKLFIIVVSYLRYYFFFIFFSHFFTYFSQTQKSKVMSV